MALTKINASVIANNTIAVGNIADNSVDATKIASNSILTRHIDDDQITGDQLSDNITIAGTLASTGVLTANAGVVVDNITIDGTEIDLSSGDLTLDVAGNIVLNADGGGIQFYDGSDYIGSFGNSSTDFSIMSRTDDKDIVFKGIDNSSTITALTLDMSNAGTATFNNYVIAGAANDARVYFNASSGYSPRLQSSTNDLSIYTNNEARVTILNDGKVGIGTTTANKIFNIADSAQGGETLKLHFEADSSADKWAIYSYDRTNGHYADLSFGGNYLYLKSGGNVGIGETSPLGKLHVKTADSGVSSANANADDLIVENSDYTGISILGENESNIHFGDNEDPDVGRIEYSHSSNHMVFRTNGSDKMLINSSGVVSITKAGSLFTPLSNDGLVVQHSDATGIRIIDSGDAGGNGGHVGIGNDNGNLQLSTAGDMLFDTGFEATDQLYNGRHERMRITSIGNLGLGDAASEVPVNDSGGSQPLYLSMHRNAGNLITMSADHSSTGELIGGIDFANDNNADAANNDADGKLVALMRARTYTDDSNASDDSGGILQFATKDDGGVLAERLKINETGEIQIKGQYNSSGNSQFAFKTVFYQFDMDSGGTHYLQVPLYSSYSSSNSSGWAEMDIAWFPDHASHTHLHSYKFMWGSDHTRILNLGVISATANETGSSYGPYNITSKSQLFRHPTAGENNMTYLYIKMQGYHGVNKRRVITLRGVASADANVASIGPVIDHGSTEPVANMVSVNAEIESA